MGPTVLESETLLSSPSSSQVILDRPPPSSTTTTTSGVRRAVRTEQQEQGVRCGGGGGGFVISNRVNVVVCGAILFLLWHQFYVPFWRQATTSAGDGGGSRHSTPAETAATAATTAALWSQDASVAFASLFQQSSLDGTLYAFTIRDAQRLVPTRPPEGMHVFDYVDVYAAHQDETAENTQLYLDGRLVTTTPPSNDGNNNNNQRQTVVGDGVRPPCDDYSVGCYKEKVLQVFDLVLRQSAAPYFFYMEADNELCVPLSYIRNLAVKHQRYFIGTGIGASGWIMSRKFVQDFLVRYRKNADTWGPDVVASFMLIEKNAWSVMRQYLVSHTLLPTAGASGLTVENSATDGAASRLEKHLPRCLEPHRGPWGSGGRDDYGWDYFDYNSECAKSGSEIYPCS